MIKKAFMFTIRTKTNFSQKNLTKPFPTSRKENANHKPLIFKDFSTTPA